MVFEKTRLAYFLFSNKTILTPTAFPIAEELLTLFLVTILTTVLTDVPQTFRPLGSTRVPWWNSCCYRALRTKRAQWKSYRHKQPNADKLCVLIMYKQASAHRCVLKNAKRIPGTPVPL